MTLTKLLHWIITDSPNVTDICHSNKKDEITTEHIQTKANVCDNIL